MKKMICVLMALTLFILCGCSQGTEVLSNEQYSILENDGVYTMKLHDPAAYSDSGSSANNACSAPYTIEFSSVAEMKATIEDGTFTEEQLVHIQSHFTKDNSNNVLICDPDKLYDATFPDGITISSIHWFGDSYNFLLDVGEGGYIRFTDKEWHDETAKRNDIESGTATIISVSTVEDRDAKVVVFDDLLGAPRKMITYSYTSGNKTISIAEQYNLDESEVIPYSISFWGTCDGAYFTGYMLGVTERPSYEWVTSFGLKPYVETETE